MLNALLTTYKLKQTSAVKITISAVENARDEMHAIKYDADMVILLNIFEGSSRFLVFTCSLNNPAALTTGPATPSAGAGNAGPDAEARPPPCDGVQARFA